jgi:hypothetical protein
MISIRAKRLRRSVSYRFGGEPSSGIANSFGIFISSVFLRFLPARTIFGLDRVPRAYLSDYPNQSKILRLA